MRSRRGRAALTAQAGSETLSRMVTGLMAVGKKPEEQLQWLMDFAERDVGDEGRRQELAQQVDAFCMRRAGGWRGSLAFVDERIEAEIEAPTSPAAVPDLQRHVKELCAALREQRAYWFPAPIVNGLTWPRREASEDGHGEPVSLVHRGGGVGKLLGAISHLLVEVGSNLRACERPGCGRLFVARRSFQVYCSPRCANRVHIAKFRKKHSERVRELRHARYKRSQPKARRQRRRE
jgi:hypothetical protein